MIAAHAFTHSSLPCGRRSVFLDRKPQRLGECALRFEKTESRDLVHRIDETADATDDRYRSVTQSI